MCLEYLGLLNTFTCLYDQKAFFGCVQSYLSPQIAHHQFVVFPPRDPPNVVLQRETVAMWAQIRHCDSSLSSNWRDDAPQVVRAPEHDLLHNAHLFCLVLCYLFKGFFNSVKGPVRGFHLFSEGVFIFFPSEFLPAFLLQPALETSLLCFFLGQSIPTSTVHVVLFHIIFQILPRYSFFSTTCLHCTFVSGVSPSENC